ncbi:hypothetical protein COCCADRAFT_9836 [Bipolaris zeicola 26-R-13]|uniref:Uncharacterized protein n=1 Tax=Cochliobolus carbonum (strain 26-R-13) TaxID=930089 RepID=W6Y975_COCC2|nr:uncharacterized protein COCCADRAFT_9836 [Bipolaris zeicola 26-R-13]EUC27616.1 hypothetical protein COCCADRAFT_9836 [Bipolaris zeicola 26-R-13]
MRWGARWYQAPMFESANNEWSAQSMPRNMEVEAALWALQPTGLESKTFKLGLVQFPSEEQGEHEEGEGVDDGMEDIEWSDDE